MNLSKRSAFLQSTPDSLSVDELESRMMLSSVDIYAAGSMGDESMQLLVDGEVVNTFDSVGGDFQSRDFWVFNYTTDETLSADQISVRFINDAWDPANGIDRNLFVDRIVLDGNTFEAEHEDSHVSALWINGGVNSGNFQTETLNVNGQIDFSSSGQSDFVSRIDIVARGTTGDEIMQLRINDEVVQSFNVETFNDVYSFSTNESVSLNDIKVEFINDFYLPGSSYDPNLTVESVEVTDIVTGIADYSVTDSGSVFSTGTWTSPDGVSPGYGRGSTLHANGYFDFSEVATQQQEDIVLQWNNVFNEVLVNNIEKQNPGYATRSMAMFNLAIHDAVAITTGAKTPFFEYNSLNGLNTNVDSEVAASQAAFTVLNSLYQEQSNYLQNNRLQILGNGINDSASIALGTAIGNEIIAIRANDGFDKVTEYSYGTNPGDFKADPLNPNVPVWGPGWGEVDTFAISSAESFRPESTPALTSQQYADSYNEVKELGGVNSTARTAEQTEIGIFWAYDRPGLGTPMNLFNDAIEAVAVQEGNSFLDNVELYARASVAMADAGIVAWQTKFGENFWRPITAIQAGDTDGNPLTEADPDWISIGAPDGSDQIIGFTPQFPTYISGHATFGGAVFGALQEFYGTDDISFELSSKELEIIQANPQLEAAYGLNLDDATRQFSSFSEAMAENGRSRVYLGIHFDFDDIVGQEVGKSVASQVFSSFTATPNDYVDSFTVNVYGTDVGANFNVLVDGQLVGVYQAQTTLSSYEIQLPSTTNPQKIQIEFTNDRIRNGRDRNLVVESIQIADTLYDTDAENVFSTGTWNDDDGFVDGMGRGNTLHKNGYFVFNV